MKRSIDRCLSDHRIGNLTIINVYHAYQGILDRLQEVVVINTGFQSFMIVGYRHAQVFRHRSILSPSPRGST